MILKPEGNCRIMAPPNKKIRVTFLWTDESALVEDFTKKSSKKMVEWANAFFGKYGFELDVSSDTSNVKDSIKYCLSKTDGYEPDLISHQELNEIILKEKLPTLRVWYPLLEEIPKLEVEESSKREEINAVRTQHSDLPLSDTVGREILLSKLIDLLDEYIQITGNLATKRSIFRNAESIFDTIDKKYKKRKDNLDFDTAIRLLIGKMIINSLPLDLLTGIQKGNKNYEILDEKRLKIIFCRFRLSPNVMSLNRSPQYFGITTGEGNHNSWNGQYMWKGPFILINISRYEPMTIAHEIVHATTGRHDLDKVRVLKSIEERKRNIFRAIKVNPVTGEREFESIYEYVYEGDFKYPNDIINYNSKGKKPSEVILSDDDQKKLEKYVNDNTP